MAFVVREKFTLPGFPVCDHAGLMTEAKQANDKKANALDGEGPNFLRSFRGCAELNRHYTGQLKARRVSKSTSRITSGHIKLLRTVPLMEYKACDIC